jgi:flagellar biosynthesis/type III secretory pathway protein FliH
MKNMMASDERQKGFEEGYAKGRDEGHKITASIEYELSAKCNSLAEENKNLREQNRALETELFQLRAQMDVVYLIFSGKRYENL